MQQRQPASMILIVVALCVLAAQVVAAADPFVSVSTNDGSTYSYFRTEEPLSAVDATAACATAGGTLASLSSPEQVLKTIWSQKVIDAAASADTTLHWTGLKITWPSAGNNRRMLRSASGTISDDDADGLLERLIVEMDASDFAVPTMTGDGRRIPQEIRAHMYQQRRALLASTLDGASSASSASTAGLRGLRSVDDGNGDESPYLRNARLSWADGSSTAMLLANPSNLGFLACNKKKVSTCCGAVFDIGPDPYPGAEFPTIFFYPCDTIRVSGAMMPSGYTCVDSPVAELPDGGNGASPKPAPSPRKASRPVGVCKPGNGPVAQEATSETTKPQCKKCKAGMFSTDGLACKKCPAGKSSVKGAKKCT